MMDVVGYCTIKKDATTGASSDLKSFLGQDVRVVEFGRDGCVLVINAQANALATFDKCDVIRSFKCGVAPGVGVDILTPQGMDMMAQMVYATKVMSRKGGYEEILKQMVIQCSLMKGEFDDRILFAKERDDDSKAGWEQHLKDVAKAEPTARTTTARSREFKDFVTALKKAGFTTVHWFETCTTINRGFYCIRLANDKISVLIYDGYVYEFDMRVFYCLTHEYNKMGDCYHAKMPKDTKEREELLEKIKNTDSYHWHPPVPIVPPVII